MGVVLLGLDMGRQAALGLMKSWTRVFPKAGKNVTENMKDFVGFP